MSGITININAKECYDVQIAMQELNSDKEIVSVARVAERVEINQYRVRYIVDYLVKNGYVVKVPYKISGAYKRYFMRIEKFINPDEDIVQ